MTSTPKHVSAWRGEKENKNKQIITIISHQPYLVTFNIYFIHFDHNHFWVTGATVIGIMLFYFKKNIMKRVVFLCNRLTHITRSSTEFYWVQQILLLLFFLVVLSFAIRVMYTGKNVKQKHMSIIWFCCIVCQAHCFAIIMVSLRPINFHMLILFTFSFFFAFQFAFFRKFPFVNRKKKRLSVLIYKLKQTSQLTTINVYLLIKKLYWWKYLTRLIRVLCDTYVIIHIIYLCN